LINNFGSFISYSSLNSWPKHLYSLNYFLNFNILKEHFLTAILAGIYSYINFLNVFNKIPFYLVA